MSIAEGLFYVYLGTMVGLASLYLGEGILGSVAFSVLGCVLLYGARRKWDANAIEDYNSDV